MPETGYLGMDHLGTRLINNRGIGLALDQVMNNFSIAYHRHAGKQPHLLKNRCPDSHVAGMTVIVWRPFMPADILQFDMVVILMALQCERHRLGIKQAPDDNIGAFRLETMIEPGEPIRFDDAIRIGEGDIFPPGRPDAPVTGEIRVAYRLVEQRDRIALNDFHRTVGRSVIDENQFIVLIKLLRQERLQTCFDPLRLIQKGNNH